MTDARRQLPSVDRLLRQPEIAALCELAPRNVVVHAIRAALDAARTRRSGIPEVWVDEIRERMALQIAPSLRPVLNGTGVVLHTNLGRAPLPRAAIEALHAVAADYSTLEYDLATGTRGHRADHCRALLAELTGAEDALAVNNAAGALVLALNALAEGGRVLISRGELIEIGGSFRIPDIMTKSGVTLVEVGTTNRTHLTDYERALPGAAAVLTVHRSNFEQRGFVASPAPSDLAALAHRAGIPYIHDVGSGLLADLSPWGLQTEPRVTDAVGAGADVVVFSGDKLLGGPQAGCLVGSAAAITLCRANPFARAFRADKFTLAALEATLALYREPALALREIPVLRMLVVPPEELRLRAVALAAALPTAVHATTAQGESAVGGGSFPDARLETTLVVLDPGSMGANALAQRLRLGDTAVIARVSDDRVLLDPRTLPEGAESVIAAAVEVALAG